MVWQRQAWCPRCDEVRRARPGSACPACSARMVALPPTARGSARRSGRAALVQRLRSLLPAARAVAAGAVVIALVAGAFVAGRSSRPASAAAAPATTSGGSAVGALPGGGFVAGVSRNLGWSALHGELRLTLRRITATGSATRIVFEVSGLERDWTLAGVRGLHLQDARGQELATRRLARPFPVVDTSDLGGGTVEGTLEVDRRIDPNAVAAVTVDQVVAFQGSSEQLDGTLVDADLKRLVDQNPESQVEGPDTCPSCRLQVRCRECQAIRLAGSTYQHGQVVLVLSQVGQFNEDETLADADIQISSGGSGQIGSFETSAPGGDAVIQFPARDLAAVTESGNPRMPFTVLARVNQGRAVNGPWRVDQRSGQR